jgi:hypothetical protein
MLIRSSREVWYNLEAGRLADCVNTGNLSWKILPPLLTLPRYKLLQVVTSVGAIRRTGLSLLLLINMLV